MTNHSVDRHEHVHVSPHRQERIVHDVSAEQRLWLMRFTQLIWLALAVLEVLILIRVMLKLIAANPATPFAALIYGFTDLFLFPFAGLTATPAANGAMLEIPALIGMLVYFFATWAFVRVIWLVFDLPRARTVTTYEEEPVVHEHVVYEEPVVRDRVVYEERVHHEPVVEEEHIVEKRVVRDHNHNV